MSEWKEYSIQELFHVQGRIGWKGYKRTDLVESGPIVVGGREINSELFLDLSDVKHLSREKYEESPEIMLKHEDVLVVCRGNLAEVGIYHKEYGEGTLNPSVVLLRTRGIISPLYSFYYLSSSIGRAQLLSISSGSSVPAIYQSSLKTLQLPVPEKDTQNGIVEILKSLDDKIDLLHRQNQTLEQMAETLFRQWFVERKGLNHDSNDFSDDLDSKNHGYQANQKNQGSDNVEEADEGWEEVMISDYAEHCKVSIKPSANPLSIYAHYSIPGFDNGKEPVHELGREIRSNKYQVFKYTILFSKLNPHKDKRVWLIFNEVPENAICSTEFQVVKPYNENHLYFLYGWLSNSDNYREISSGVGGTSGSHQRISPSEIFSFSTPKVSDEILNDYASSVKPIFQKQNNNQTQIRTLTALRDTLLPKLMSGEVRVESQRDETFVAKEPNEPASSVGAEQKENHG
jgi:type I restriction enzyme S subunit